MRPRVVLDSGAVIRLSQRRPVAGYMLGELRELGRLVVPSMVVAECIFGTPADANVNRFLKTVKVLEEVSESDAREVGRLRSLASRGSAVDGLVVVAAGRDGYIVTGDLDDIKALVDVDYDRKIGVEVIAV